MCEMNKILLINFGGIGDEILFLPVVTSLRKKFPDTHITLALEPRSACIENLTYNIDDIVEVDIKGRKYFELLKFIIHTWQTKYDMVISSGSNALIPILLAATGIPQRYGYESGFLSRLLLTKTIPLNKKQYACAMYHDLVQHVCDEKMELPEIRIDDCQKEPNSVLIHPGVSKMSVQKNIIKTFNPKIWVEVIERLLEKGKKVYLAGGPDDDETIRKILSGLKEKNLKEHPQFVNLYKKTRNIMDLARKIKKAECMICTDSAPMHIGVAVGTKVYAIFGPTDEKKLLPEGENYVPITVDAECRPCLWDSRSTSCNEKKCLEFTAEHIIQHLHM